MTNEVGEVIVMGIWGHAGGDGVPGLIKELTPRLTALGVPVNNIFSMSWNPDHNVSPFETPATDQHLAAVQVGCPEGVSCGRSIPDVNNHEVQWRRDWNGNRMRRSCPGGRKPRHSFHLNIDSDRYVWWQIIEQIEVEVRAMPQEEVTRWLDNRLH